MYVGTMCIENVLDAVMGVSERIAVFI